MKSVTQILDAATAGDTRALDDLLPLVYDELCRLAASRLAQERPGHTLDASALVHEAWLRLVGDARQMPGFESRAHFFAAAAEAMRRVLVNHARDRNRLKRAGSRKRVDFDRITAIATVSDDHLIELNDSLDRLAADYPEAAAIVKLRFFTGLSQGEAAQILQMPRRSADRQWAFARAWLTDDLSRE